MLHRLLHYPLLAVLISSLLGGCSPSEEGSTLVLAVRLPDALERNSHRQHRFWQRARSIEVISDLPNQAPQRLQFPPQAWEALPIPNSQFSKESKGALEITVRVWDVQKDGQPRSQPALVGKQKTEVSELKGLKRMHLPLRLQVSAGEYDW